MHELLPRRISNFSQSGVSAVTVFVALEGSHNVENDHAAADRREILVQLLAATQKPQVARTTNLALSRFEPTVGQIFQTSPDHPNATTRAEHRPKALPHLGWQPIIAQSPSPQKLPYSVQRMPQQGLRASLLLGRSLLVWGKTSLWAVGRNQSSP